MSDELPDDAVMKRIQALLNLAAKNDNADEAASAAAKASELLARYNKATDSRFEDYRRRFGDESWEMDALEPTVFHSLIRDAVEMVRDELLWNAALAREADDRDTLDLMIEGMT